MAAPIKAYLARGTGNPMGNNMCTFVAARLDKKIFYVKESPFAASIAPVGGRLTMQQSIDQFAEMADAEMRARVPWMGIGYSLGAMAMGNFVGTHALSMCKGIGLIADPLRHRDQIYGPRKPGTLAVPQYGIAGERKVGRPTGYPVWSMSELNDPISECPEDNGMRMFSSMMGSAKAKPRRVADWAYTAQWVGYYAGNRHTNYGVEKVPGTNVSYVQRLADLMNAEGRNLVAAGLV